MHNMENDRICTPWKMTEKTYSENDRVENAHPENYRKISILEITEKASPENERMENARHGKCQNAHPRK